MLCKFRAQFFTGPIASVILGCYFLPAGFFFRPVFRRRRFPPKPPRARDKGRSLLGNASVDGNCARRHHAATSHYDGGDDAARRAKLRGRAKG